MNFAHFRSSAIPLFVSSNILPVNMLYIKCVSVLMKEIHSNLTPDNISDLFIRSNEIHNYNTGISAVGNYYIEQSRLNKELKSFSKFGAVLWNSIPSSIRDLQNRLRFKTKLHNSLLDLLKVEDEYLHTFDILSKISK